MRSFRRETLHEQLVREAGLGPPREPRLRTVRALWERRPRRERRTVVEDFSKHELARTRDNPRVNAPDTTPPGFG
jgi:hypothetical protein